MAAGSRARSALLTQASGGERVSLPAEAWTLAGIGVVVAIGFGIVAPAIPDFALQFGVGRTAAALVVTLFAGMRIVSALFTGALVNRFGEARTVVAGLTLATVTNGLAAFAADYPQLLIARGLSGIGSAMFTVAAAVLVIRTAPLKARGRANSVFFGGFMLGAIVGPVVGGPLSAVSLRLPFIVYGGLLAVATVVALLAFRRLQVRSADGAVVTGADADSGHSGQSPQGLPAEADQFREDGPGRISREADAAAAAEPAAVVWDPRVRRSAYIAAIAGAFAVGWLAFGVRFSTVPLFVTESLGRGPTWSGIVLGVFAVLNAVLLILAGRWVDRVGRKPIMIVGTALVVSCAVLLVFPAQLSVLLVSMVLGGSGVGLLAVAPSAVLADVAPARAGMSVAFFQMATDIGAMIGPLAANALVDILGAGGGFDGYSTGFAVTAVVLSVAVVLAVRMPETRPS